MGKGRAADRVGSDFLSAIAGRVGSTFRRVGSGLRKVTLGQHCTYLYNYVCFYLSDIGLTYIHESSQLGHYRCVVL